MNKKNCIFFKNSKNPDMSNFVMNMKGNIEDYS